MRLAEGGELPAVHDALEPTRFLTSGDESGTAPEDRAFRPDVEGLRAIAVLLVVLYHAGWSWVSGGYVGVDVFFVISGFVITGVLLRERTASNRTSLLAFYGRRVRRILPAATLVIIATVFLSYVFLGSVGGDRAADDGTWAAVFLANFHFISTGTSYLGSQRPPSPLQNYWSLAVEEQFYVVYPTLLLVLAGLRTRLSLRVKLALALTVVFCGSLAFSVIDTASSPTSAYFSPFTRAWELALGALVAVATPLLQKVPDWVAALATWGGFAAIITAAVTFTNSTPYPGSLVAIPVVGAALIIAGGVRAPTRGVEVLLGLVPFRALGKLSYSLYLWHWPILILVAEHDGATVPRFPQSLGWVVIAVAASTATYFLVENPVRHSARLRRLQWTSVALGIALAGATVGVVTAENGIGLGAGAGVAHRSHVAPRGTASLAAVVRLVARSSHIRKVPADLSPPVATAALQPVSNLGAPPARCYPVLRLEQLPRCTFGDRSGRFTAVLYGDSHAGMWFPDIKAIATRDHWRLIVMVGHGCALSWYPEPVPGPYGEGQHCNELHRFAVQAIERIRPNLVIVAQAIDGRVSPAQWQRGLADQLARIKALHAAEVVIGNEPFGPGPSCLAEHPDAVQSCSIPVLNKNTPYEDAEQTAAAREGADYIDVTPWFCTTVCSSVIGRFDVFFNFGHVAIGYAHFLEGVLAHALDLPAREHLANH